MKKIPEYFTTKQFFDEMIELVKVTPEYTNANIESVMTEKRPTVDMRITTDEFDPLIYVSRGSFEGIYINCFISHDGEKQYLGCLKTLEEDNEAIRNMHALSGHLFVAAEVIRNHRSEELEREGFSFSFYNEDQRRMCGFTNRAPSINENVGFRWIIENRLLPFLEKNTYIDKNKIYDIEIINKVTLEKQRFPMDEIKQMASEEYYTKGVNTDYSTPKY